MALSALKCGGLLKSSLVKKLRKPLGHFSDLAKKNRTMRSGLEVMNDKAPNGCNHLPEGNS